MSFVKRQLEEDEEWSTIALSLLCEVKALRECDHHDGIYFDGPVEVEAAYRLANARITRGEIKLSREMTRRDFSDTIKETYESCGVESICNICAKNMAA